MQTFLGLFLSFVALCVAVMMLVQARRGTVDLFSVRNFFLLGFIVFQLTSGTITLFTGYYDALRCSDYAGTGLIYTGMALIFLVLYLAFYRWGFLASKLAGKIRSRHGMAAPGTMLVLASSFLLAAIFCRLVLTQIPVVGVLALIVTTGLAGAAASAAAWVWAPRWSNPIIGVIAGAIILGALGIVLYQAFGRRDALSVLIATLWGAHHGYWRHIGWRRAAGQVVPLAAGVLIFMGAFSAGRKEGAQRLGFTESITRLASGNISEGILAMASGQAAAACSMWVIETRPKDFPYDTFHTLWYTLTQPIPRVIWAGKPIALGWAMTSQGRVRGKSPGFSFGPGLMGHIANDNPWLSMVPYAFLLAFLCRFMDQVVKISPTNPFLIIPLGVALGDILGVSRGEAGLFLSRSLIMMVSSWIGMGFCASLLGMLGLQAPLEAGDTGPGPDEPGAEEPRADLIDPHLAAEYGDRPDAGRAA